MLLEELEIKRFAAYCERQVNSCIGIADQLDKIGHGELANMNRRTAEAYQIVMEDLRKIETQDLS